MGKREYWEKAIRERKASGKGIAQYCNERGIRQSQFWYWNRMLSRTREKEPAKAFVPVGAPAMLEIVLRNGATVRLPADGRIDILKTVLEALDAVGA